MQRISFQFPFRAKILLHRTVLNGYKILQPVYQWKVSTNALMLEIFCSNKSLRILSYNNCDNNGSCNIYYLAHAYLILTSCTRNVYL